MEDPKIMIFDEPFNGVENDTAASIRALLKEEAKKDKIIIIASHIILWQISFLKLMVEKSENYSYN